MAVHYLTLVHIAISLIGIASGFGALSGWMASRWFPRWTTCFLLTTLATSVTGFFFPFRKFTPAIGVGILSLVILGLVFFALYARQLRAFWCKVFVIGSVAALYLNFFVLVVQLFQKMPALVAIAPEQSGPAFGVTQLVVLVSFLYLGWMATKRFQADATRG